MALRVEAGDARNTIAKIRTDFQPTFLRELGRITVRSIERNARRNPQRGVNSWPVRVKPVRIAGRWYRGGNSRDSFRFGVRGNMVEHH